MKKILLGLTFLASVSSYAGPLEEAFKASQSSNDQYTNPTLLNTEILGELAAKIYTCTEESIVPCDKVSGDKNYQIGIVTTYMSRLKESEKQNSFEYTLATTLFLKLKNGSFSNSDTVLTLCKKHPNYPGCS